MEEKQLQALNITIGGQSLQKGELRDGKQLVAWDCVQECDPLVCPIGNNCTYVSNKGDAKCQLQIEYIQSFINTVFGTYRYMGEDDMYKVGMHLVPLYSQLCRQKIVEKSVKSLCYEDAKGRVCIHPIYKEMRETMKVISMQWKDIGISAAIDPNLPNPNQFVGGRAGFGDPNHYTNITAGAEIKRNVIR